MSLKGFENITHELTVFELETIVPMFLAKISGHKGKINAITNAELRAYFFDRTGKHLAEPRIRKVAEHVRQSHLEDKLVATNRGYFIAEGPEELEEWLVTMRQRRNSLTTTIAAGEKALKHWTGRKQPNQHKQHKADLSIIQPNIL